MDAVRVPGWQTGKHKMLHERRSPDTQGVIGWESGIRKDKKWPE